jgi:hypothetical protein
VQATTIVPEYERDQNAQTIERVNVMCPLCCLTELCLSMEKKVLHGKLLL